jgi:hypothetical protein
VSAVGEPRDIRRDELAIAALARDDLVGRLPPVTGSRRMSASTTKNPRPARRSAIARPMPDDEPVTITERGMVITLSWLGMLA